MIVFDRSGNQKNLAEAYMIGDGTQKYYSYDIYDEFDELTNPSEGFKKIYNRLPSSQWPLLLNLNCGAQYIAIAFKMSSKYGAAIIFGYSTSKLIYIRLVNGSWYETSI